mmetsp:Transcript_10295/g.16293  ORF Transcript_10295/g.16293 Transcript_10295/m.16293 type:complete len:226 (-) Transcript_10295:117-794(-)
MCRRDTGVHIVRGSVVGLLFHVHLASAARTKCRTHAAAAWFEMKWRTSLAHISSFKYCCLHSLVNCVRIIFHRCCALPSTTACFALHSTTGPDDFLDAFLTLHNFFFGSHVRPRLHLRRMLCSFCHIPIDPIQQKFAVIELLCYGGGIPVLVFVSWSHPLKQGPYRLPDLEIVDCSRVLRHFLVGFVLDVDLLPFNLHTSLLGTAAVGRERCLCLNPSSALSHDS